MDESILIVFVLILVAWLYWAYKKDENEKNYKFKISQLQHQVNELNKQKLNFVQKFTELITDDIFVSSLQDLLNNKKLLIEKANEMIRRNRNEYINEAANWLIPIINVRKENLNKYNNVGELLDNEFIGLLYIRKYSEDFEYFTKKWIDKQLDLVFEELFPNANIPKSIQNLFNVFIKDKNDPLFEGINSSKELFKLILLNSFVNTHSKLPYELMDIVNKMDFISITNIAEG